MKNDIYEFIQNFRMIKQEMNIRKNHCLSL